jgi:HrpA-like RNA helicase
MDEVHERDIDIDFALIIVKHFLKVFPEVKLILMSATICSEKFSNYFCPSSIANIDSDEYLLKIQSSLAEKPQKREANPLEWGLGEEILRAREEEYQELERVYKAQ